ncbi:AAA family ATPase [Lacticaseibacillus paracasei]|uniref:AAA family ATPase n=1 Tax=Lacticaseibacillus paracasei TaxID=1597 RepID=UPI003C2C39E6
MKTIELRNFRSLIDTGVITLNRLTVLVGQNSLGKSSFLRSFPLLKQSLLADRQKPLIWYSPNLVDFGSYKEVLYKNGKDLDISKTKDNIGESIEFVFGIDIPKNFERDIRQWGRSLSSFDHNEVNSQEVSVKSGTLSIQFDDADKFIAIYQFLDWKWEVSFSGMGRDERPKISVKVNGVEYSDMYFSESIFGRKRIVPRLLRIHSVSNKKMPQKSSDLLLGFWQNNVTYQVIQKIKEIQFGRTNEETVIDITKRLTSLVRSREEFNTEFEKIIAPHKLMKRRVYQTMTEQESEKFVEDLFNLCGLNLLSDINEMVNDQIASYFENVQYIAPIRATAERYYRRQDLAVNDINPQGQNIPAMLASMRKKELKQWNDWTSENFGVYFSLESMGNNDSIYLTQLNEKQNIKNNLADVGFGYSQILPILLYLWRQFRQSPRLGRRIKRGDWRTTILIEQPELHLRPALQAAEMHAMDTMLSENPMASLVIETHSEYMVNQLGHDIAEGVLHPEDVSVLIFERDLKDGSTKISKHDFDENGTFKSWPIGFFQPIYK